MLYLRNTTRLSCDVYGAYRQLIHPDKIANWLNGVELSINKIEGTMYSEVKWSVVLASGESCDLAFHMMKCTQKSEYCTEVHLVTTTQETRQCELTVDSIYNECSLAILDALRVHFNKDWVIEDKDIHSSLFSNR